MRHGRVFNGTKVVTDIEGPNLTATAVVGPGNAIIHDPDFDWTGDKFVMPPWNELVIYEMHVGTFNDAPGTGPGTFEEITPKLPYLADVGVNAIEIMPVAEFPMDYLWGYNPADPFSVERAIGGPQGLYQFVKAAHAQGIAVNYGRGLQPSGAA